ncbi:hypothetical protein EDD15DRAFT_2197585 [Pisolithus albus]|nr:hypothetical protein EDD15DRAFT_2197585 [Pisolithus albus]
MPRLVPTLYSWLPPHQISHRNLEACNHLPEMWAIYSLAGACSPPNTDRMDISEFPILQSEREGFARLNRSSGAHGSAELTGLSSHLSVTPDPLLRLALSARLSNPGKEKGEKKLVLVIVIVLVIPNFIGCTSLSFASIPSLRGSRNPMRASYAKVLMSSTVDSMDARVAGTTRISS